MARGERIRVSGSGYTILHGSTLHGPLKHMTEIAREADCGCAYLYEGDTILPCREHRAAVYAAARAAIERKGKGGKDGE